MTTQNEFLPAGYVQPEAESNYMKFVEGENKFRVLTSPIVGFEDWDNEKKVYRYKMDQKPEKSKREGGKIKHFWAMVVWNYKASKIQILNITQVSIQKSIQTLVTDPDWGKPFEYDLVVIRAGEGMETEYQVNPKPKKDIDPAIKAKFVAAIINLDALYTGDDPFSNL